VADLIKYLLTKVPSSSPIHAQLLLSLAVDSSAEASTPANPRHIGLVLSERLVNMPGQIMPPMYNMLTEELEWALEDVSTSVTCRQRPAARAPSGCVSASGKTPSIWGDHAD